MLQEVRRSLRNQFDLQDVIYSDLELLFKLYKENTFNSQLDMKSGP